MVYERGQGRLGLTLAERRAKFGHSGRLNDDALHNRSGGCSRCGNPTIYFDGVCLPCFEDQGGDGPGRDSMG